MEGVRESEPKPPRFGMVVAVALEIAMLGVFAGYGSLAGVALWCAYFWFSATCAMLQGPR